MSEYVFNKFKSKIEKIHPEWIFNQRGDGNWSLSSNKVFAYFDYGRNRNVVIRARIYPNNSALKEFTSWKISDRVGKIGSWKDEVIDIPLIDENKIDEYLSLLEITLYGRKITVPANSFVENIPSVIGSYLTTETLSNAMDKIYSWLPKTSNSALVDNVSEKLLNDHISLEKNIPITENKDNIAKNNDNFNSLPLSNQDVKKISSDDIKKLIYPLAYCYYFATEGTSDLYGKMNAYFKLFEIVSTFNSLVLLSVLPHNYIREYETTIWTKDKNRYSRLSMGLWVDLYRRLSNIYKDENRKDKDFLNNLPFGQKFYEALIDKKLLEILEKIPEKRNRFAHSGTSVPEGTLKKEIESLDLLLEELFSRLIIYNSIWMVYPVSMKKKQGIYETNIRQLNGPISNPFPQKYININEDMESESLYLYNPETQQRIRLLPEFINLYDCNECGQGSLYIFDKMDRKNAEYYSFHNIHHTHKIPISGLLNVFV